MSAAFSLREVFARDRNGFYKEWSDFDTELWLAVCKIVEKAPDPTGIPDPILVYYATRYIEWEVGNGGFAQAAMNIPEWFEVAALGYEILGKPKIAKFVREAARLAKSEESRINEAREGGLEDAFEYFSEKVFDVFDNRLDEIGWWKNDELRLDYARANSPVFEAASDGLS